MRARGKSDRRKLVLTRRKQHNLQYRLHAGRHLGVWSRELPGRSFRPARLALRIPSLTFVCGGRSEGASVIVSTARFHSLFLQPSCQKGVNDALRMGRNRVAMRVHACHVQIRFDETCTANGHGNRRSTALKGGSGMCIELRPAYPLVGYSPQTMQENRRALYIVALKERL